MAYIYKIRKFMLVKLKELLKKDFQNIVELLKENIVKNVHYIQQCENMEQNIFILS